MPIMGQRNFQVFTIQVGVDQKAFRFTFEDFYRQLVCQYDQVLKLRVYHLLDMFLNNSKRLNGK